MQLVEVKRNTKSPAALQNQDLSVLAAEAFPEGKYPSSIREKWVNAITFLRSQTKRGWILERELTRPVIQ